MLESSHSTQKIQKRKEIIWSHWFLKKRSAEDPQCYHWSGSHGSEHGSETCWFAAHITQYFCLPFQTNWFATMYILLEYRVWDFKIYPKLSENRTELAVSKQAFLCRDSGTGSSAMSRNNASLPPRGNPDIPFLTVIKSFLNLLLKMQIFSIELQG